MKKLRVGIVFGGRSTEHEISLRSAKNIIDAIDKSRFEVILLRIDKDGKWYFNDPENQSFNTHHQNDGSTVSDSEKNVAILLGQNKVKLVNPENMRILKQIDVIFPIVHGTFGEDGSLQGMLRIANLPFVGSDVLGSASCMDKDVTKRLLRDAGLKISPFVTLTPVNYNQYDFSNLKSFLGLPIFVKPANQGSSIGVSRVYNKTQFVDALHLAFKLSNKVVVEASIQGREIECALLGNDSPQVSICGEILVDRNFYSYDRKYITNDSAKIIVPASLDREIQNIIQKTAISVYHTMNCHGMARVDIFLTKENEVIINEINTLPGFTETSMFPRLWKASGIPLSDLISKLIEIALERHNNRYFTSAQKAVSTFNAFSLF